MAATELQTRLRNGAEIKARALSDKVSEQVSEILEEAVQQEKAPQPVLAYRVPSPCVRYYF